MARSPGMSQALARSPGLLVSTVLTCMVGALLPPLPGLTLFVGGLALTILLCAGGLERPAVRLLGRARVLSEAEAAALAPAIALLCQKGLGPPAVELYARDGEVGISAGTAGRHSVVVSAGLLRAAQSGQLPADQTAGVIAAAVGRIRLGQTRFDVAVEFWTIPWQLVRAVALAIAKTVGLFPLTRYAWRIRFVVATLAVAQSVADGRIAGGVVAAVFIALTYLSPRWQRQWDVRSQDDADRFVADHELGDALARCLRRCPPEPTTLERIHHLTGPLVRPSLALVVNDPKPRRFPKSHEQIDIHRGHSAVKGDTQIRPTSRRLLGDQLRLTAGLSAVLARAGFVPVRHRGRALVDAACALAAGATCLSDIEAMTRQVEIFGPAGGASDTTILRVLDELAGRLNCKGLPGRRLARALASARANAWTQIVARHGQLPAVRVAGADLTRPTTAGEQPGQAPRPVLVVRLDATLIEADSTKEGAAGTFKGGFGFHPLTAWCTNVGDNLAVMLRPGNAGSFTASDHVLVLDAAIGQIPARWRSDVLVTVDGAGASHEVIAHLTGLNTAAAHGKRGRRVEYSIGWPVDERTQGGLGQVRERDWTVALDADGNPDPNAGVVDLTGILRHGPYGDQMSTWPTDVRVIARRVPRPAGQQAKLGEDPNWRYGAFATNTTAGQIQWLDARHRTQAHVEDKIKELKTCGAQNLPSNDWDRNSAWLQLAALAASLNAWLRHLALDGDLARAEPKALRYRLLGAPARHVTHARKRILKIPPGWAYATDVVNAWDRLQALHPA